jgi:6-phosphogluconolactonase (cycloisomerase 2 family)
MGLLGATALAAATRVGTKVGKRTGTVTYVGSYSSDGGAGLDVASVDTQSGALSIASTVSGVPDASWLALSPDGRFLYTTNEQDPTGSVTALDRSNPNKPVVLNTQSTQGDAPTHLSVHPSGTHLLTANYGSGTVAVFPLGTDGRIGALTDLVSHTGGSGAQPLAHQIITDPSGKWVLSVDLGNDSVYVYTLDLTTGKLTKHQQVVVATGTGPRHLVCHPDGKHVYLVCEDKSQVIVLGWNATTGKLTPGQIVGTVEAGAVTPNYPGEGAITSDGRFLYVSNRGDNSIATFSVSTDGATLTLLNTISVGGDWPRHVTLDPTERWLYVSNQNSGTVTWLPRDATSGVVSPVSGSTTATAVAMVLFG